MRCRRPSLLSRLLALAAAAMLVLGLAGGAAQAGFAPSGPERPALTDDDSGDAANEPQDEAAEDLAAEPLLPAGWAPPAPAAARHAATRHTRGAAPEMKSGLDPPPR